MPIPPIKSDTGFLTAGYVQADVYKDGDGNTIDLGVDLSAYLLSSTAASTYQPLVVGVSSTEIGYLDGQQSPIVNTLSDKIINRAALRDFFAKMYAFVAAPTTTRVAIGYYGDSVAPQIPEAICRTLHQESFPRCDLQYPSAMQSELSFAATGAALTYNGSTATVDQSVLDGTGGFADFTYLPNGSHLTLANGSIVTFDGNQATGFTEARVYFATGPGMGSVFVELVNRDTSSVISSTTVNLSAGSVGATKAAFASITNTTKYKIRVTSTGASVLLHACLLKPYGVMPVNFSRGSTTLTQCNYSNQTIFEYLCSDLNVAMLTCETKEEGGQTPISNAIARLVGIDNCCTLAIGSFPDSSSSVTQLANVGYFRTAALANGCAFFDAYAAGKDYTESTRLSWNGDGTHPAQAARDYCASLILGEFNWVLSLSRKFQGSVDHTYQTTNYVASYSVRTFKGDLSGDTIEVISNSGGGTPTKANIKNIHRVYFDADGTTSASIAGRSSWRRGWVAVCVRCRTNPS
jgi:hypothetical protein